MGDAIGFNMLAGGYGGEGDNLVAFRFSPMDGSARRICGLQLNRPSYIASDPSGRNAYVVNEAKGDGARVTALGMDKNRTRLTMLGSVPSGGDSPCFVDATASDVAIANYNGGTMALCHTADDGRLLPPYHIVYGGKGGQDPSRQQRPHVHCARFSPDGRYVFATDFSGDRIVRHALKPAAGPDKCWPVAAQGGYGPRHIVFSPDGRFLYVVGELSDRVTAFAYADGELTEVQSVLADADRGRGGADIHVSPDGRFLYTSHRLVRDKLVTFARDPHNGTLTPIGETLTPTHPRHFALSPDGHWLLVACMHAGVVAICRRDPQTGLISDSGNTIRMDKVACVTFVA